MCLWVCSLFLLFSFNFPDGYHVHVPLLYFCLIPGCTHDWRQDCHFKMASERNLVANIPMVFPLNWLNAVFYSGNYGFRLTSWELWHLQWRETEYHSIQAKLTDLITMICVQGRKTSKGRIEGVKKSELMDQLIMIDNIQWSTESYIHLVI